MTGLSFEYLAKLYFEQRIKEISGRKYDDYVDFESFQKSEYFNIDLLTGGKMDKDRKKQGLEEWLREDPKLGKIVEKVEKEKKAIDKIRLEWSYSNAINRAGLEKWILEKKLKHHAREKFLRRIELEELGTVKEKRVGVLKNQFEAVGRTKMEPIGKGTQHTPVLRKRHL